MTKRMTNMVANRLLRLGAVSLSRAEYNALTEYIEIWIYIRLLGLVSMTWKKLMTAPSNSVPPSVLMVMGLKDFHRILSLTLVAMKREIPEPNPYPF
jgi:hypothetical protein